MTIVKNNKTGRSGSLNTCGKGGALIHTPRCPNLQVMEGELNDNNNLSQICY